MKNHHEILVENSSDGEHSKIGIGPPKYSDEEKSSKCSCEGEEKTSAESKSVAKNVETCARC